MMYDDTSHQSCGIGFQSAFAARLKAARNDALSPQMGALAIGVFPSLNLWQPSHGYIARLHGIIAHWLQPTAPNPNGFGGRA